jgi:hypothetical protein
VHETTSGIQIMEQWFHEMGKRCTRVKLVLRYFSLCTVYDKRAWEARKLAFASSIHNKQYIIPSF